MSDNANEVGLLNQVNPNCFEKLPREPVVGEFVLVEFKDGLTQKVFYVAKVLRPKDSDNEIEVSFVWKSTKFEGSFIFPAVTDVSMVKLTDIKCCFQFQRCWGQLRD